MVRKVLPIALVLLALAVAIPLASNAWAQEPTPTPTPAPSAPAPPDWQPHGGHMAVPGHGPVAGHGRGVLGDWPTIQRAAQLLNLTPQELFTRLETETLADIAQAQGVTLETLVTTILAPFKDTLQVRVNYGYLSQEEADFILWQRSRAVEKRLSQPWPQPPPLPSPEATGMRGPGGIMGPGGIGPHRMGGGIMAPRGFRSGAMDGGRMGDGMMGGSGQTW